MCVKKKSIDGGVFFTFKYSLLYCPFLFLNPFLALLHMTQTKLRFKLLSRTFIQKIITQTIQTNLKNHKKTSKSHPLSNWQLQKSK